MNLPITYNPFLARNIPGGLAAPHGDCPGGGLELSDTVDLAVARHYDCRGLANALITDAAAAARAIATNRLRIVYGSTISPRILSRCPSGSE